MLDHGQGLRRLDGGVGRDPRHYTEAMPGMPGSDSQNQALTMRAGRVGKRNTDIGYALQNRRINAHGLERLPVRTHESVDAME